jgi:queuine tRNA-ribosyltransferase
MHFKTLRKSNKNKARTGQISTLHGTINTPVFMPVGTQATVKTIAPNELKDIGVEIVLANTYYLLLRPGDRLIRQAGGLHRIRFLVCLNQERFKKKGWNFVHT